MQKSRCLRPTLGPAGLRVVGVALGFLALFYSVMSALAHDTGKGWAYPWECCADHDCAEISEDRVRTGPQGYVIDGRFIVPPAEVRQSPDGRYHACFPTPDKLKCFWAPPPGS